jgi:hypothetical protein
MPRVARRIVTVAAALSLGLAAGCTGDTGDTGDTAPPPPAPPTTVDLSEIDLTSVAVSRAPFCDALAESSATKALVDALGGEPRRTDAWESGDRRRVGGSRDVVHEAGCSYRRGGSGASAWVFAAPVTRRDARSLLEQRRDADGCSPAGELRFGRPGLVQLCAQAETRLVTMAGLFGDAWLTCEVSSVDSTPVGESLERAQRWCVEVVYAAGSS